MADTKHPATEQAKAAARALANLNTWGAVQAMLEGGTLSGANTRAAQLRVVAIAKREMQKHFLEYEAALHKITTNTKGGRNG